MQIKSPTLSSRTAANLLGDAVNHSAIGHAVTVVDRLSEMYDALQAHSAAVSPHETREARAMRFESAHKSAIKKAHDLTTAAAALLDTFANEANAAAYRKAGLSSLPESAQEIRSALRQMTPDARERVIADAFARGDNEVLASIHRANPVLWGGVATPIDAMFEQYIDRVDPDRAINRAAADQAAQILGFATDGLLKAAEAWRDPEAAARGEAQAEEFARATNALSAATRD